MTSDRKLPPPVRKSQAQPTRSKPRAPKVEPRKSETRSGGGMRLTVWVALAIILVDQALKYWVVHVLQLDRVRAIDVFPPWLNLRMAWNQGVNFGLMSSDTDVMRWVLIGVAVVICLWVWIWLSRSGAGRMAQISGGLLIGGAIGNVIDRIYYGAVADFLNMSLPNWQNPFSFNVADIAIFAGAIGLILMPSNKEPAPAAGKAAPTPPRKPVDKTRDEQKNSR